MCEKIILIGINTLLNSRNFMHCLNGYIAYITCYKIYIINNL